MPITLYYATVFTPTAVIGRASVVASDDGRLHVLDPQSGQLVNAFDAGDSIWAAPLLADDVLYVASVNGKLHALDAETLDPVWESPFEADQGLISDMVPAGDAVLVGGLDRTLHSVAAATGEETTTVYERSDFCPVPRAVPILEAVIAFEIADALIEKLGGDTLDEMKSRYRALRQARLDDLSMEGDSHIFWSDE